MEMFSRRVRCEPR